MEQKIKITIVGVIDPDGYRQDNLLYSRGGCSPTLRATNDKNRVLRKYKTNNRNREDGSYAGRNI